jgi:hypothetical protein
MSVRLPTRMRPNERRIFTPSPGHFLQRKCTCGQHTIGGSECGECSKDRQTLQRATRNPEVEARDSGGVPPIVHEVLRSPGQPLDAATRAFFEFRFSHDFSRVRGDSGARSLDSHMVKAQISNGYRYTAAEPIHSDGSEEDDPIHRPIIEEFRRREGLPLTGVDEYGNRIGPSDAEIKYGKLSRPASTTPGSTAPAPAQSPRVTPCPTSVRVGAIVQRNHSNLSASEKEQWGTWLGAMSHMDVGPGPDHTGHCMKERLTTVSNNCPAAVYSRGGTTTQPCAGDRCLDVNRGISSWGVSDGPTAFLDMHRTRAPHSLLEGTGVSACTVSCEQTYSCDRTQPTTGTFRITRNFQASSHTKADRTTMHITTGTVTKT